MTQHHPTHPQPAAHTPARLLPAIAPSFKDLPRRTRSPLRMTHPKPSALFSKKASVLPLNLFSWSAASLATIAVLSSYGTPVQAEEICYITSVSHPTLTVSNDALDPGCTRLVIMGSRVEILNFSDLPNLISLNLLHNDSLTSIDFSGLSNLEYLQIFGRSDSLPSSLDLSGLSNLNWLRFALNKSVTSLDLSGLSNLTTLMLGGNELTNINFSGVCNLRELDRAPGYNSSYVRSLSLEGISKLCRVEEPEQEPEPTPEEEPIQEPEPTPEQEEETTPEQEPTPEEELDNTIKDILEGEGTSEEKLERVKEATDNWSKEQKQEALSKAKKEVLIGAAKVFAEELLLGGTKTKVGKAIIKKGLEKAAKYSPKVAELIKKGESVKKTIDKIKEPIDKIKEVKDTVDDVKNIKEGVDVIIEEVNSNNKDENSNSNDGGPYQMEITPEGGETEVVPLRPEDVEIIPNKSSSNINRTINNIAEALYLNHDLLQGGYISLDQAFSGQDFSVPFNLSQVFTQDQGSSPRFNALLSADIGFSRFSDSSDSDFYIDGTTTNYGIGLTVIPNPEVPLITGLQFGYTQSNSDFESTDLEGTYNLRMFSVHPFIGWDATDSLTVWSVIGYGRPNDETTINSVYSVEIPTEEVSYSSSGDFFSFAGGANYRVWQSDLSALSIGLSGSTTSLLDNDSQQGSISAQFSHDFPLNTGQLQTSADLALILSDSGPSATELSGNLNWLPNQGRLSGSTNARVLLFGGDRSEWGIGGSVVLLPGERGEGLSLALRPSFGQTNTTLSNLHLDPFSFTDPTELALSTAPLTARFNAALAYGFPTGNHALLTPYTKLSMGHYGATTSAGLRYHLDSGLDLDLSASHRQRSSGNNDNRFFLQLRSDL